MLGYKSQCQKRMQKRMKCPDRRLPPAGPSFGGIPVSGVTGGVKPAGMTLGFLHFF
ncbi:MAG: hypothetical protein V4724_31685 [Pseudomonadota bacterium]